MHILYCFCLPLTVLAFCNLSPVWPFPSTSRAERVRLPVRSCKPGRKSAYTATSTTEGKCKQDSGSASHAPFLGKGIWPEKKAFCQTSRCILAMVALNYLGIQNSPQPAQALKWKLQAAKRYYSISFAHPVRWDHFAELLPPKPTLCAQGCGMKHWFSWWLVAEESGKL